MMGQIANGVAKEERTYGLKMQSKYDGSDREWRGEGRRYIHTEGAEQVRWSDREWRGKGRKDVQSEDAERVQQVRSRMVWRKEKGRTA